MKIDLYTKPVKTPCTALKLAQAYEIELGGDGNVSPEFIAVLMAHGVLECGQDRAKGLIATSCYNFNLGNVKAGESWPGRYTCITLNEYLVRGGKRVLVWFAPEGELRGGPKSELAPGGDRPHLPPGHPQTRMRALDTLTDGVRAKLAFLRQPHFAVAWACAMRGDGEGYVRAIHAQRYFTADLEPYVRGVVSLFKTFLPVAQKIAAEPIVLPKNEQREVDAAIAFAATQPGMLADLTSAEHVAAVQFDLRDSIDWRYRNP